MTNPNKSGLIINVVAGLIVLGGLFWLYHVMYGSEQKNASSRSNLTSSSESPNTCKDDLQCLAEEHLPYVNTYCPDNIVKLAKYGHKWTDGFLDFKFTNFKWADKSLGTIRYIGDKLQIQNRSGAWQNALYSCDFDPDSKSIVHVSAVPGRL